MNTLIGSLCTLDIGRAEDLDLGIVGMRIVDVDAVGVGVAVEVEVDRTHPDATDVGTLVPGPHLDRHHGELS